MAMTFWGGPGWRHLLAIASAAGALLSCGPEDDYDYYTPPPDAGCVGEAGVAAPIGPARFDPAAREELVALGLNKYAGQARVKEEQAMAKGVVRVTYDSASGPICIDGSDYKAFYVDRRSDKLLISLDSGGACWSRLCMASATADDTYDPGRDDCTNYLRDYNTVFVPYCDGSVFWGDNDVTLPEGIRYHRGQRNLAAALDGARARFPDVKRVLLYGVSAGGYGTLVAMLAVRLAFPSAELLVIDDSGPGLQNPAEAADIEARLREWNFAGVVPPSCVECEGGRGQITALFSWMLARDPTLRVALLSYYEDPTIGNMFLRLPGPAFKELLVKETDKVHAAFAERFQRFFLTGNIHVVGSANARVAGVTSRLWLRAMAEGDRAVWTDLLGP